MIDILGMLVTMGDLILGKKKDKEQDPISEEKGAEFYLKEHPVKKFNYRPQTLSEYISQDNAKLLIKLLVKEILEVGKYRHILISGTRGHGKTTLGEIICKSIGFEMNYFISNAFTKENLREFLVKNEVSKIPQVLMLDEVHGLDKAGKNAVGFEYFYPILEDMKLPNTEINLNPFIIISCTTELDYLQRYYPPFVDRFVNVQLEHYKEEDIKAILTNYNNQVYQKNINVEDFKLLSQNSRFNPRTAILMFDLFIASGKMDEILKCFRIVKSGLTTQDIIILDHLFQIKKPVGCETLAIIGNTDKETYMTLIEPYLLQEHYLGRTSRGRLLLPRGEELLRSLDENQNMPEM